MSPRKKAAAQQRWTPTTESQPHLATGPPPGLCGWNYHGESQRDLLAEVWEETMVVLRPLFHSLGLIQGTDMLMRPRLGCGSI